MTMQNMADIFAEVEAEAVARAQAEDKDGTTARRMEAMRIKSEAEYARMLANGAIETGTDNTDDDDDDDGQ